MHAFCKLACVTSDVKRKFVITLSQIESGQIKHITNIIIFNKYCPNFMGFFLYQRET